MEIRVQWRGVLMLGSHESRRQAANDSSKEGVVILAFKDLVTRQAADDDNKPPSELGCQHREIAK